MPVIVVVITIAICIWTCDGLHREDSQTTITHTNGEEFAGSESCARCHKAISETHSLTAHSNTSREITPDMLHGSFEPGSNVFALNDQLKVEMQKDEGGFFQVGFVDGWESIRKPMEIAIGSGRKAQTYLYWEGNQLRELPVSYYVPLDTWCNSPGYPNDRILFDRPIPSRCLECHGTYAKTIGAEEQFEKSQMILGITCERCHGPAKDHVNFHTDNPTEKSPRYVINPAKLSRQMKLDNCALCHSGIRTALKPTFTFIAGDTLDKFSKPDYSLDSVASLDVHGNQYGLLTSSKCFQLSEMDCSSCHNVHEKETENLVLYSQRCMTCHQPGSATFCKQPELPGLTLSNNCIDCHMPALPSSKVFVQVQDRTKSTPDLVRTHRVAVYREQVMKMLKESDP